MTGDVGAYRVSKSDGRATSTLPDPLTEGAEIEELGPEQPKSYLWVVRLISMVTVLGAWEFLGRRVDPLFMSYPTAIAEAAVGMIKSGELTSALISSLSTLVYAFTVASVIGIGLGLLIGRYKTFNAATDWLVNALYTTPQVAIIPLVILWLGLGYSAKIFIVTVSAVFPILINTTAGVRNVPSPLIDVGLAFAASERQIFSKLIVPSALPYVMTGLRLGLGRAIIGMVVAEFFTAITGLGAIIVKYGNQFDTASMFVPIFLLMFLGAVLSAMLRRAESWIAPWKEMENA
jgi:ABC-type nitrate/sulfonate/bicarbonate transport system permease component